MAVKYLEVLKLNCNSSWNKMYSPDMRYFLQFQDMPMVDVIHWPLSFDRWTSAAYHSVVAYCVRLA